MKQSVTRQMRVRRWTAVAVVALGAVAGTSVALSLPIAQAEPKKFELVEATVEDVHAEYKAGRLTARALVRAYLDRIEAYDRNGPKINSVITINPKALEEADALDAAYKRSGPVGPLHGIPVVLKDQMDVAGLPTTLGSVVFKDVVPTRDAFVTDKLKKAGAIILAKVTLGEMGGGDSYGSLYGVSRNPYDPERTVGGSSGGTGAAVAANFATIGVGQEGFASIRRPSTWNSIVGMRPTPGLVSRGGVWAGWPSRRGSLGPMTRTVTDMAKLLDVMVGYDPDDPVTALGVGQAPKTYTASLDQNGLKGARIGILREPMGYTTEPDSEDFKTVTAVFDKAVAELKAAGAVVVDPIVIPRLNELLARRGAGDGEGVGDGAAVYFSRHPTPKFKTMAEVRNSPDYGKVMRRPSAGGAAGAWPVRGLGPRRADDRGDEGDGRQPARRHRPQVGRAHADADQGRHQPALRQPEGRASPQHVPDLRRLAGRARPASRRRGCRSGSPSSAVPTASRR